MTPSKTEPNVLIVAAEASSALYASRLLELWKNENESIQTFGVGSQQMVDLGFEALGRSEQMAVVGIQEVIKHYGEIKEVFEKLIEMAKLRRPRFALLLDYPDFNLRLAKELKKLGIIVVYYISPQVWAWRTSRVHKIKKVVDKMLVVFPFEKEFYKRYDIDVEFVGHPLLDEIKESYFDKKFIQTLRQRFGIDNYDNLVGLMPGSRWSELKHHLSTQIQVADKLFKQDPNLKFAILVAPTFSLSDMKSVLPETSTPIILIKDDPMIMAAMCDEILCASGTATLLVGLIRKPMVIMYKMNGLTAWLAKKFVKNTPFFGLINIVVGQKIVPEYFQEEANPTQLSEALLKLIDSPQAREDVTRALGQAHKLLGEKGATQRVAAVLKGYL